MENVPTCQESRIECIKPLKFQIIEVHDALITLSENSLDVSIKHESLTLSEQICDLSFHTLLITWYDILKYINIVSKTMQSKSMDLGTVIPLLKSCTEFLTDYRMNGFEKAKVDGIELSKLLNVEPVFKEKRTRKKKF